MEDHIFPEVRVQRARKLLEETGSPIKEIGYLCGFREPRALIRACNRWMSAVPGRIRQAADRSSETMSG
jgi:transcriptional regulator GlxA family with amidase domain